MIESFNFQIFLCVLATELWCNTIITVDIRFAVVMLGAGRFPLQETGEPTPKQTCDIYML
jgi:hypothetical protein